MAGFWDRVFELILSRGQREKHEKFLWDKKCGGPLITSSLSCTANRPSLERVNSPDFKPTVRPTEPPQRIASTTSMVSQTSGSTNSPTLSTPSTTPLTHFASPIHSVANSPTHHPLASKAMANYASRGPLPRRPREDRAYLSLEPLVEAQKLLATEKPWVPKLEAIELPLPRGSPPLYEKPVRPTMKRQPLLYEVPQLSETQGVGRYRRSVNATEQFIDATTNNRNDSFSDLLALVVGEKTNANGEWVRPQRITGNMDTTSPPPPRRAFSRGNSPVRLAIYGETVDEVAEEELEERDGKLIFGRRRTRGSSLRCTDNADATTEGSNPEKTLVTTSDPGVMTTEAIVATIQEEKKKKPTVSRDDEGVRGRKKSTEKNLHRALVMKPKVETATTGRIRHVITPTEAIEEAVETGEDDDVEEVESFSDRGGMKLAKSAKAAKATTARTTVSKVAVKTVKPAAPKTASGGSKEKEKVLKAPEGGKKKRVVRGAGQAATGSGVGGAVVKATTKRTARK